MSMFGTDTQPPCQCKIAMFRKLEIMKVKFVFISILAIIFVMFFGLPSLRNYRTNNTLISEKKVKFMERDVPAITIAAAEKNDGENAPHG